MTISASADPPGPVVFGQAELDLGRGGEEEERVASRDERDRHLLSPREPRVAVHAAVLAG